MSDSLFFAITGVCFVIGLPCRHWKQVGGAAVLWLLGLGVAALAGAFRATAEDNALGVFFFTGIPTMLWLLAFCLGALTGVSVREATRRRRTSGVPGD